MKKDTVNFSSKNPDRKHLLFTLEHITLKKQNIYRILIVDNRGRQITKDMKLSKTESLLFKVNVS